MYSRVISEHDLYISDILVNLVLFCLDLDFTHENVCNSQKKFRNCQLNEGYFSDYLTAMNILMRQNGKHTVLMPELVGDIRCCGSHFLLFYKE